MSASPTSSIGFQNFFSATLSADITASSTDIFLDVVPAVSESFLVIDPDSTTNREIIYFNSKTATKVTCPSAADGRGQGDTTAVAHLTGTAVIMAPVAEYFETLLALFTTSPQGWTSMSGTVSAVTYNGNRSYDLTTSSDQSAVISPGMRLRTTRTVAAPTQSTSLNGTTQYFSKTTPAGTTFTDDFVVSAWVKLSSYAASTIISQFNGSSGWTLRLQASGTVRFVGYSGGGANFSIVDSYQSLPLNKWVHVTAQLDMSAFTATTTTSYVMRDGVDVPCSVVRGGTNPTTLVQAGNLEVGSENGGTNPFPGKIAQAAVFSAKVTQATMRGYMNQGLLGTETSLISAYSFDGTANDLNTTNANNLTANGSATTTNADSPFGGQAGGTISATLDYGIVQKVTASTITTQVAEGCAIPTSGGVGSASYSTYKSPYGFPGQRGKWAIETYGKAGETANYTNATWTQMYGQQINLPIGSWKANFSVGWGVNVASAAIHEVSLSTSSTSESDSKFTDYFVFRDTTSSSMYRHRNEGYLDASTSTIYYLVGKQSNGLTRSMTASNGQIVAENAYL